MTKIKLPTDQNHHSLRIHLSNIDKYVSIHSDQPIHSVNVKPHYAGHDEPHTYAIHIKHKQQAKGVPQR